MTHHWKGYDDGWHIIEKDMMTVTSLKRLPLTWTKKPNLTCHWKGYTDVSLKRLWWQVTHHWKGYDDGWHIAEKATMMGDITLKRLWWWVTHHFLQLTVAMSLHKDMPFWNASSHFTHTLSPYSRTTLFPMSDFVLPAWNRRPFYRCQH
jgi:hypothetical protein